MNDEPAALPTLRLQVPAASAGQRLDVFLTHHLPQYSRNRLRQAVVDGRVHVDGERQKSAYHVKAGQCVTVIPPPVVAEGPVPEEIALDIVYEDAHLVAVHKPAGMVVHPAKGHWSGTLVSALAHHFDALSTLGGPARPGIVHRLDRDTSGVMVVAKTDFAHMQLARQFEQRTIRKQYFAIVRGGPDCDRDVIDQPIGAHPYHREKKAIRGAHSTSRPARTLYEVVRRFRRFAVLSVFPQTGRTHQIRVHLAHVGCPIVCDRLYAGHARITRSDLLGERPPAESDHVLLTRQALHASRLELSHPEHGRPLVLEAPLPADLQEVLKILTEQDR